jgi:hypothetical protein
VLAQAGDCEVVMSEQNQAVPYGAYEGGAKVLSAVAEVLNRGGSAEKALAAGRAALSDLQPRVAEKVG